MNWRRTGRVFSAALMMGTAALTASSASAQRDGYERVLAGIRLNSSSKDVLRKFGNPNQIVIGDVGMRNPPAQGGGAAGGQGGMMGGPAMGGGGRGPAMGMGMSGGSGPGGPPVGMSGGMSSMGGGGPRGMMGGGMSGSGPGGPPMGGGPMMGGGMMGGGMGAAGKDDDQPGAAGGGPMMGGSGGPMGGFGGSGGMMGGGGPGFGPFGQNTSTTARQQEVTWIYNRKFKDVKGNTNVVSYEFLIGPGGRVSQIRVLGYYSKGTRTQRGVVLGSTYKDLVRLYGYPEEHTVANGVLIVSFKNRAHANFQLIQSRPGADPSLQNYKIIAITIASVE